MNKKVKGKRKATKSGTQALGAPPAKVQKKDEATWCADCWGFPTAACGKGKPDKRHRLVEAAAARTEVASALSEMCSEMKRVRAKIKDHRDRLNAVDDLFEKDRPVLSIEAEVGESSGLSIKGGVFKLVLAVANFSDGKYIKQFCRALDGVDFWHSDTVNGSRPATFSTGMPWSLFERLPDQPDDSFAVREGTVLVTSPDLSGSSQIRIYTKSVKPLLTSWTKVLGRVTENLNAVAMDVGECCANTKEMGGGLFRNAHVLQHPFSHPGLYSGAL